MDDDETPQTARDDDVLLMLDTVRGDLVEEIKALAHLIEQASDTNIVQVIKSHTEQAKELTAAIGKTCDTLLRRLDEPVVPGLQGSIDEIVQVLRGEKQGPPLNWRRLLGLACGLALLSGGLGWWSSTPARAVQQRAQLMEHVHGVLIERYPTLPADLKAQLKQTYVQQGFVLDPKTGGKP